VGREKHKLLAFGAGGGRKKETNANPSGSDDRSSDDSGSKTTCAVGREEQKFPGK